MTFQGSVAGRVDVRFTKGDAVPDSQPARYDSPAVIDPNDQGDDLFSEDLVSNRISDTPAAATRSAVVPLTRSR